LLKQESDAGTKQEREGGREKERREKERIEQESNIKFFYFSIQASTVYPPSL